MRKQTIRLEESGNTLIVSLVVLTILGTFVGYAVQYTGNVARNGSRDRIFNTAVEIGDGCISEAFSAWRQICKTQSEAGVQNPPTNTFSAIPSPSPGNFPSYPGAVITNYKVQAVDPLCTLSTVNPPLSALNAASPPPKATGPGTGTFSYFYLASADVTLPAMTGTLTAKVRRVFEKRYTSPWNWAMMYAGNLELHPASNFTLNGWVHTNGDAYVGNNTNYLTLTDRLTHQGNYTLGFDPNDTAHSGAAVTPTYPADLPPGHEQYYSLFGWDESKFNTSDTSPNNDGYQEMIDRPDSGHPDPFAAQRLYNQAAIVVTINDSNVMTVYQGPYTARSNVTGLTNSGAGGTAAQAAAASITPNAATLQDGREQAAIRLVDFDVAIFKTYYPSSTTKSWNGIIYIVDTSGTSTVHRAIRVKNAAKLPSGGMTIVSENPVYIWGDFNTGKTSSAQPPSNTGNPADSEASGYDRVPSSVMGDAITLLSNNWSDANLAAGLASRIASNTTVNAALVSGNVPTGTSGSIYSGGGENFVRYLEDWTAATFTYYGSMLNLYASKQGVGAWGFGNYYLPPAQHWYFDSQLSVDKDGNPVTVPGYISTVAYLQQQRWYLQY